MMEVKGKVAIFVLVVGLTTPVFAQPTSGSTSSGMKGFYLSLAGKGGLSKIASDDNKVVESRDLLTYGGELTLGMRTFGLMVGGTAEYLILNQRKDPSDLDGTNASGKMLALAPTIGIPFGRFLFQARPHFYSTYTLDQKAASGEKVEYSAPELPSYTLQLVYSLGRTFLGFEYTNITYKKRKEGSEEETLEDKAKLTVGTLGLVYGYKF